MNTVQVKLLTYRIGHPVYGGANRLAHFRNPHRAVMELIERGVHRDNARAAVNRAAEYPYPHTTVTTQGGAVIELVCIEGSPQ